MTSAAEENFLAALDHRPVDLAGLREAIAAGANVSVLVEGEQGETLGNSSMPALSLLIRRGELEAVLACLESPEEIDFTSLSDGCISPLHEIALANTAGWPEYNRRVLRAVVDRIARHPTDTVDWSMMAYRSVDLLSLAAQHQLLSVFWPVLQSDVSYFADQTEPISLTEEVWAVDWAALGTEEQRSFSIENARFLDADETTSRLWVASLRYPEADAVAVRACVAAGVDPTHTKLLYGVPLLCASFVYGSVEVVEALLATPRRIDFAVTDEYGGTPLHWICAEWNSPFYRKKTPEEVRRLLHLLLDRIEQHPQEDTLDWGRKDNGGHEPISIAARNGHLAPFVEVVLHERPVPYFTDHPGKIEIAVTEAFDMDCLRREDRERFQINNILH
eukprot:gene2222-biopygen1837